MFDTGSHETQAAPGLEALPPGGSRARAILPVVSLATAVVTATLVLAALTLRPATVGAQDTTGVDAATTTTVAVTPTSIERAAAAQATVPTAPASTEAEPAAEAVPATEEARFVELINELRRSEGLVELTVDLELVAGAEVWTEQLIADGGLSHAPDLSVGVTSYWLKLGENVGFAPAGEIVALFDAFVASPTHYANLVDPDFTHVGVAVVVTDDRIWTTHRFMHLGD